MPPWHLDESIEEAEEEPQEKLERPLRGRARDMSPLGQQAGGILLGAHWRAQNLYTRRAPNIGAKVLQPRWASPRAIPDPSLAFMQADAGHFPKVPSESLVDVPNPVRLAHGAHVVQKGKHVLAISQLGLGASQGVMDAQRKQHGHQGVTLLATFSLLDEPRIAACVAPGVPRRFAVRQANEWQHGPCLGQAV